MSTTSPEVSARPAGPSGGIVGLVVIVASLVGLLLWLSLLLGPLRLATGLLDAADHIDRAEQRLSKSDLKKGRYEALSAAAAVERAEGGLDQSDVILDLARVFRPVRTALPELDHVIAAAKHSSNAAAGSVEVAGRVLKGRHRVVVRDPENPEDSTIRLDKVEELGAALEAVHSEITATREELEAIKLKNIPKRARHRVTEGITKAADTELLLEDAEAGFKVLPSFLGANGPRNYLFAMQNNAELRGTGGAMLQFTLLHIEDGKPELGTQDKDKSNEEGTDKKKGSTSVYDIDDEKTPLDIPLPADAWYHQGIADARRFGNANWSPDWPRSAELTIEYGQEADSQKPPEELPEIDGVIAVDPIVMQELVGGTGRYRTENCKNRVTQTRIVSFLLYKAYATYPNQRQRRGCLRGVVEGFYGKVVRPKSTSKLFSGMAKSLTEKHMQMWMRDPAEQRFVRRMNWDGAIEKAKGSDYLYLVEQNVGGNKLDYYNRQTTTSDITIEGEDALHRTEASIYSALFLPQPRFAMGDTGRFDQGNVHRPMLNLYVPADAVQTAPPSFAGDEGVTRIDAPSPDLAGWSSTGPAEHTELGKKVWTGTLQIPPQREGSLTFDYRVPGVIREVDGRRVYRLHVQHQPKVQPETLILNLTLPEGAKGVKAKGWKRQSGRLVWERPLEEDLVLEVSWRE
jgi:hypothetical protein